VPNHHTFEKKSTSAGNNLDNHFVPTKHATITATSFIELPTFHLTNIVCKECLVV
jgi:hypothetical protein